MKGAADCRCIMSFICLKDVRYSYSQERQQTINGISLDIEKGSFVAVIGHNGSGKSTLAKLMCGILTPAGGSVSVDGIDTSDENRFMELRRKCGMVFQNPDNQIVATIVEEDVAFAPENLGVEPEEIRRTVDRCLAAVGMSEYRLHSTTKLSGGQKQKIAIAGVLAMNPDCIVFDEATAMLDPQGRADVMETLERLNRENGMTVITITHYMNEACMADRVIVLNGGSVVMDGTPREIFSRRDELAEYRLAVPQITELCWQLSKRGAALPSGILHTMEAADAVERIHVARSGVGPTKPSSLPDPEPVLELRDISVTYGKGTPFERRALDGLSISIPRGKVVGVIGHTGSGKSTFARLLNGLLRPDSGTVLLEGRDIWQKPREIGKVRSRVGMVFQYPEYQLFAETVYKDIAFGPTNMGITGDELDRRVREAAAFCGLGEDELSASHFDISGGQKRRAAIAGVVAMEPSILVLDEPAAGLDPEGRDRIIGGLVDYHVSRDVTLVIISHSMEDIARTADYILVLGEGRRVAFGTVPEIFRDADMLFGAGLDVPQVTKLFVELSKRSVVARSDVYTIGKAMEVLSPVLGIDACGEVE